MDLLHMYYTILYNKIVKLFITASFPLVVIYIF